MSQLNSTLCPWLMVRAVYPGKPAGQPARARMSPPGGVGLFRQGVPQCRHPGLTRLHPLVVPPGLLSRCDPSCVAAQLPVRAGQGLVGGFPFLVTQLVTDPPLGWPAGSALLGGQQ